MPRNGSGVYSLPTGNPVITGTTISSTVQNNTMSDVATALTNSIAKDGQTTPTANLPMGGFKLTSLAAGTATTDSTRVDAVQDSDYTYLTSVSGTNTITANATPTPDAYKIGQLFHLLPAVNNTGATTLNISGLGAGAVQSNGAALVGGELRTTQPIIVEVSAATPVFQIVSKINPIQSLSSSGYSYLPGGLIYQWGVDVTDAGGSVAITFPLAFTTALYSIVAMSTNSNSYFLSSDGGSATGATIYGFDQGGTGLAVNFRYIAIGK